MTTLHILSGGAAQGLVESQRAAFEAAAGCTLAGTFGAVGAMRQRLLDGAPADLLILSRALIEELAADDELLPSHFSAARRALQLQPGAVGDLTGELVGDLLASDLHPADQVPVVRALHREDPAGGGH